MKIFIKCFLLLSLPFIFSCEEDKATTPIEKPYAITMGSMVMVGNEGNFRTGNASVSLYNLSNQKWLDDAFGTFNKKSLGDVFQSATFWNGLAHLVVNNSGKIESVKPENFEQVQTLSGFTSPRFLLPVSSSKAYVSDLYANKIWIVSGNPMTISGNIPVEGWTEDMVMVNNRVWVVNKSRPVLMILNPTTDQLVDSMVLPSKPTSIARATGDKIWVGLEGPTASDNGKIILVDPGSKTILRDLPTLTRISPDKFQSSTTGDSLFFVDDKPRMMFLTPGDYTFATFNEEPGTWSGIAWNPVRKILAYSDVKDYVQKSRIFLQFYDGTGARVELKGGTISTRFYFY